MFKMPCERRLKSKKDTVNAAEETETASSIPATATSAIEAQENEAVTAHPAAAVSSSSSSASSSSSVANVDGLAESDASNALESGDGIRQTRGLNYLFLKFGDSITARLTPRRHCPSKYRIYINYIQAHRAGLQPLAALRLNAMKLGWDCALEDMKSILRMENIDVRRQVDAISASYFLTAEQYDINVFYGERLLYHLKCAIEVCLNPLLPSDELIAFSVLVLLLLGGAERSSAAKSSTLSSSSSSSSGAAALTAPLYYTNKHNCTIR